MGIEGKTFLLTRASGQNAGLGHRLERLGANIEEIPTIEFVAPRSQAPLDDALGRIGSYDWVLFTSATAVDRVLERGASRLPKIVAVGAATARRLEDLGHRVDLVPERFSAAGLLEVFPLDLHGVRILFPRAETGDEGLPGTLRARGAQVDLVTVYRTRAPRAGRKRLRRLLGERRIDCIVFTSGSTVHNLIRMLGSPNPPELLVQPAIAVIGPVTRDAAVDAGLRVDVEAKRATIPDLVEALRAHFDK